MTRAQGAADVAPLTGYSCMTSCAGHWHKQSMHFTDQDAACSLQPSLCCYITGRVQLSVWRARLHEAAPVAVSHQALLQLPILCEGHHELRRPCGSSTF